MNWSQLYVQSCLKGNRYGFVSCSPLVQQLSSCFRIPALLVYMQRAGRLQHVFKHIQPVFKFPHYQYFVRAPGPQRSLQISKPTQHSWRQKKLTDVTTQLPLVQYLGKGNEMKLHLYKTATCRERGLGEWTGASNYSNSQKQELKETSLRVPIQIQLAF